MIAAALFCFQTILEASPPSSQAAFSQLSEMETANESKDRPPACFQPIVIKILFSFRTFYWLAASSLYGNHNEGLKRSCGC